MSVLPTPQAVFTALEATWAPAQTFQNGPFTIRRGAGGGKRVSAATAHSGFSAKDILAAETAMTDLDQIPLFMIRDDENHLDQTLENLGYEIVDPTILLAAPSTVIASSDPHHLAAIECEQPLALMAEIWAAGGIGAERLAVMKRSADPKTYLFSRLSDDAPGGCVFLSADGDIAMFHALEVLTSARRIGVAQKLILKSARWAIENGARTLATATTGKNLPAQKLFAGMGMTQVGGYHYRMKSEG